MEETTGNGADRKTEKDDGKMSDSFQLFVRGLEMFLSSENIEIGIIM